jgi:hypothetical protein
LPKAIICVLDGTLVVMNGRNSFGARRCDQDLLNQPATNVLKNHKILGDKILLLSGREDQYKAPTLRFLETHEIVLDERSQVVDTWRKESLLDFCYAFPVSVGTSRDYSISLRTSRDLFVREGFSVQNWLKGQSINTSFIRLAKLASTNDMFTLFYYLTVNQDYKGIIQKGKLQSSFPFFYSKRRSLYRLFVGQSRRLF